MKPATMAWARMWRVMLHLLFLSLARASGERAVARDSKATAGGVSAFPEMR
jgi:hypothetical protein